MDESTFTAQHLGGGNFGGFHDTRPASRGHLEAGNQYRNYRDTGSSLGTNWPSNYLHPFNPPEQNIPFTEACLPSAFGMLLGPDMNNYMQDSISWTNSHQPNLLNTALSATSILPESRNGVNDSFSGPAHNMLLSDSQPSVLPPYHISFQYPLANNALNMGNPRLTSQYPPALNSLGHVHRMNKREPALSADPYIPAQMSIDIPTWATSTNKRPAKRQAEAAPLELSHKVKTEERISPITTYRHTGLSKSRQGPRHPPCLNNEISGHILDSPRVAKRSKSSISPISTDGSLNMSPSSPVVPISKSQKKESKGCRNNPIDSNSSNIIVFNSHQDRSSKPTRTAFDPQRRKEVAKVRALGACFKCKMWRKKCNLETPCQNCQEDEQQREAGMLFNQPCFRLNLDGCHFFRYKSALWTQPLRKDSEMKWISTSKVQLHVKFSSLSERNGPQMAIDCCHFQPERTDVTQRKWGTEVNQVVTIPTYCAYDREDVRKKLPSIIEAYSQNLFQKLEQSQALEPVEPVMLQTLQIARRRLERGGKLQENEILRHALNIWYGVHFMAQPRTLSGSSTLGLDVIRDPSAHDNGYIPIPPMLDYQLDTSAMEWMENMMKPMLKLLWKNLLARSKKEWFNIFLTFFILLDSLETVYGAQVRYVQEHGNADSSYFGRHIEVSSEPMLERWTFSAQHLIFVFHYYIKRRAFGSAHLFSHAIFNDAADAADLDPEAREYYSRMINWLRGSNHLRSRWKTELLVDKV